MGGARSTHGEVRSDYRILVKKPGMIILKAISRKYIFGMWIGFTYFRIGIAD
jgi:hypothetical protein